MVMIFREIAKMIGYLLDNVISYHGLLTMLCIKISYSVKSHDLLPCFTYTFSLSADVGLQYLLQTSRKITALFYSSVISDQSTGTNGSREFTIT